MSDPARFNALALKFVQFAKELAKAAQVGGVGSAIAIMQVLMAHAATIMAVAELYKNAATRKEDISDFALEVSDVLTFLDPESVFKGFKGLDPALQEQVADAIKAMIDSMV